MTLLTPEDNVTSYRQCHFMKTMMPPGDNVSSIIIYYLLFLHCDYNQLIQLLVCYLPETKSDESNFESSAHLSELLTMTKWPPV